MFAKHTTSCDCLCELSSLTTVMIEKKGARGWPFSLSFVFEHVYHVFLGCAALQVCSIYREIRWRRKVLLLLVFSIDKAQVYIRKLKLVTVSAEESLKSLSCFCFWSTAWKLRWSRAVSIKWKSGKRKESRVTLSGIIRFESYYFCYP